MRIVTKKIVLFWLYATLSLFAAPSTKPHADFSISFKSIISNRRICSVFVLPNDPTIVQVQNQNAAADFYVQASIPITRQTSRQWTLHAPATPGVYTCTFHQTTPSDSIRLNVFVMTPYANTENLDEYKIGRYPSKIMQTLTQHKPPSGFIKATQETESILISPHFRLSQFLCKEAGEYPKYLLLQEKLLQKLELIIEKLDEKGFVCHTLTIMSGFRTPYYNKALGNVAYSQHCWGGAADIYIDRDGNDIMDDLNHDGRCDVHDAEQLKNWIDEWSREPVFASLLGGLARYRYTNNHGPFVHVDVRGFAANWGE
jgi:hypothetical protein